MKVYVEASLEDMDKIMVELLKELIDDNKYTGFDHPDDVKYNKKLKKAANILLDYYGY